MKNLILTLIASVAIASTIHASQTVENQAVITTGTTVSLTGTTGATVSLVNLTGTVQQFVCTGGEVIVLSSTTVTANPIVKLVSGATVLSATASIASTANASTTLAPAAPNSVLTTSATGSPISLSIVTGGTATALNARVSIRGYYLK